MICLFPAPKCLNNATGGGPGAVFKAACLESRRSQGRTPLCHSSFKETKMFLPRSLVEIQYCVSLCDREVVCSASDRQGSNFESCVWRAVSSHSSHHPQEVFLAQFSLDVHRGGLKSHSFHFLVQWLMLAAWKVGDRGFEPRSGIQVSKKRKCFFPAHS